MVSPTNGQAEDGRPLFYSRDVPVDVDDTFPDDLAQPNIYVGEDLGGYVVVDTDRQEVDYQDAEGRTQFTEYDGEDGVNIGSLWNKVAFALRFGDINPLISGNIRSSSKILYQRDVKERVEALAPFLTFDADPYPVLIDGGIQFVVDAYTTSNSYPYRAAGGHELVAQRQWPERGLQLRPQLDQGRRRRLRGHREVLRHRPRRPPRRRLRRRLPRPLLRRSPTSCGPTSATRRTCSGSRRTCGAATT